MKDDPIVEEARKAGRDYLASFGGDLKAAVKDLQRREAEERKAGRRFLEPALARPVKRVKKRRK